jgi:hypothetical protein
MTRPDKYDQCVAAERFDRQLQEFPFPKQVAADAEY